MLVAAVSFVILVSAASAATPEWVWAFRRQAKTMIRPFNWGHALKYAQLGEKVWRENGHPGRGWQVTMRHRWGGHMYVFTVDQPERRYIWCVSNKWCEETVKDEPITDAWNYAYASGMSDNLPGAACANPDFPRRGQWTLVSKTEVFP